MSKPETEKLPNNIAQAISDVQGDAADGSKSDLERSRARLEKLILAAIRAKGGGEAAAFVNPTGEIVRLGSGQLAPGTKLYTTPTPAPDAVEYVSFDELFNVACKAWDAHQAACRITTPAGSLEKVIAEVHRRVFAHARSAGGEGNG